jgi:hypothetical protein
MEKATSELNKGTTIHFTQNKTKKKYFISTTQNPTDRAY